MKIASASAQVGRQGRQRFEPAGSAIAATRSVVDVLDVAVTVVQRGDPLGVDVEADRREARLGEADHQGQPDVAEPDDPDDRLTPVESLQERVTHGPAPTSSS